MRYQYRKRKQQTLTSKQVGAKYGFRSGLEEVIAEELTKNSVDYTYEETKLQYVTPQQTHTYTPAFYLLKQKIFIETKRMFTTADRQKMRLIKEQYPELDIRFVFSNARARISKKSKTTHGMWCQKYGFLYAHQTIPKEWLD